MPLDKDKVHELLRTGNTEPLEGVLAEDLKEIEGHERVKYLFTLAVHLANDTAVTTAQLKTFVNMGFVVLREHKTVEDNLKKGGYSDAIIFSKSLLNYFLTSSCRLDFLKDLRKLTEEEVIKKSYHKIQKFLLPKGETSRDIDLDYFERVLDPLPWTTIRGLIKSRDEKTLNRLMDSGRVLPIPFAIWIYRAVVDKTCSDDDVTWLFGELKKHSISLDHYKYHVRDDKKVEMCNGSKFFIVNCTILHLAADRSLKSFIGAFAAHYTRANGFKEFSQAKDNGDETYIETLQRVELEPKGSELPAEVAVAMEGGGKRRRKHHHEKTGRGLSEVTTALARMEVVDGKKSIEMSILDGTARKRLALTTSHAAEEGVEAGKS